jgi:hypothetical protein
MSSNREIVPRCVPAFCDSIAFNEFWDTVAP